MLFLLYYINIVSAVYYSNITYNDSSTSFDSVDYSTFYHSHDKSYSSSLTDINFSTSFDSLDYNTFHHSHIKSYSSSLNNVYTYNSNSFVITSSLTNSTMSEGFIYKSSFSNNVSFSSLYPVMTSSVESDLHTYKPRPMLGIQAITLQTCYSTDEVPMSVIFGYTRGDTKTESNKQLGLQIVNIMKNAMAVESRESFYTVQGNAYGFMWVGSMVQNRGFKDNLIPIIENEIRDSGTPKNMYIEYDGQGDPLKSFGFMIDIGSKDNVIKAAKAWSQGKKYNVMDASKTYNPSVCYSSYANRKKVENDNFVGECDYFLLESGKNPSDQSGINGESLQGYNPSLDFSNLSPGTPICKSIGSVPDKRPKPNSDGSCVVYKIQKGDSCSAVAAKYFPLSIQDIEKYNQGNLRWGGCNNFLIDDLMCVSSGTVPKGGCKDSVAVSVKYKIGYYYSGSLSPLKDQVVLGAKAIKNRVNEYDKEYTVITINGNVIGMSWLGSMVQNTGAAENLIQRYIENVDRDGIFDSKFVEYVVDGDPAKSAGIIFDTTGNKDRVFNAIKSWSKGKSLSDYSGGGFWEDSILCYIDYNKRKIWDIPNNVGKCEYFRVESGVDLVSASGVTSDALILYNPSLNFNLLAPNTPVCKTIGSPPDFRPSPNSDGSCFSYTIQKGDTCSAVAAKYYPLSISDIEKYNKDNFAWGGCNKFLIDDKMCVSSGSPPRPKSDPNAECGPYAPGDLYMSKCPLNACCSRFGYCGLTSEFCDSDCFSNCDYGSLTSGSSASFVTSAYWMDTYESLHQDVSTIDGVYDIIYYSFGTINEDMSITVGSDFGKFKSLTKSKKIISFGGWDFSTNIATYTRLRNAVKLSLFVDNLKNFVLNNGLDGVNFDWEYPAAPDIPGIPPGDKEEIKYYTNMVANTKNKLPNKLISVAIPASFWYLKMFNLTEMVKSVDYFVLMNYDYYGQWDYGKNLGVNCHVDKRSTVDALKLINKAGIPFSKIHGGLANYARTYKLSNSNCNDFYCDFVGPYSGATPGSYSNTPGFLTENELLSISTFTKWTDGLTMCDVYVYEGGTNWAAYINKDNRKSLISWYKSLGLSGTALWASNYENTSPNDVYDYPDIEFNFDEGDLFSDGVNKAVSLNVRDKLNNIIESFNSLHDLFNVDEFVLTKYFEFIDAVNKNKNDFDIELVELSELMASVIHGLVKDVQSHSKKFSDKDKIYIEFYYNIFNFIFPSGRASYIGSVKFLYSNIKSGNTHWANIDSGTRDLIRDLLKVKENSGHDELRRADDEYYDLKNLPLVQMAAISLHVFFYTYDTLTVPTHVEPGDVYGNQAAFDDLPTVIPPDEFIPTPTHSDIYSITNVPNYQRMVNDGFIINDVDEIQVRLRSIERSMQRGDIPTLPVYMVNIDFDSGNVRFGNIARGRYIHVATNIAAFTGENLNNLINHGSYSNGLLHMVRTAGFNRESLFELFDVEGATSRDEFPFNSALLMGYTREEQNRIVRLANMPNMDNIRQGIDLNMFYRGDSANINRRISRFISYRNNVPEITDAGNLPRNRNRLIIGDEYYLLVFVPTNVNVNEFAPAFRRL